MWKWLFRYKTEDRTHEINDRLAFIKCKTSVKVSGERQATDWEKISAEDTSDKCLSSKTYKELLKLNNNKTNLF